MKRLFLTIGLVAVAAAQSIQNPATSVLPIYTQYFTAPGSTPETDLSLSVDASSSGGDFIDVVAANPQVLISLILPNGTEVTPSNASSLEASSWNRPAAGEN
jgi:hypothetical protein